MEISLHTIERVNIVGSMDERDTAMQYTWDNGYSIIRSGPYPIDIGRVDPSRFLIIGERYIPQLNMKITEEMFIAKTGSKPKHDDLERVNCPNAGRDGHTSCGWCDQCDKPKFMCSCPS